MRLGFLQRICLVNPCNNRAIIEQGNASWCGAPSPYLQLNVQYKTREINGLC